MSEHLRARRHFAKRQQHLAQRHLRQRAYHRALAQLGAGLEHVALEPHQLIDVAGGALEALVLLQPAHQFGPRILLSVIGAGADAAAACAT